jgi:aminoglycoside phosphotransferase family enzyme/predicted kinase
VAATVNSIAALADQTDVVAFLAEGTGLGCSTPPQRIDTHAATIFLTPHRAWKLKRAVNLRYLDFSTSERRRTALYSELALNRRTAPELYLAVHPITREQTGALVLDGVGDPVDWLLEMRRFPDGALLDEIAAARLLSDSLLIRLADTIAAFHLEAPIARNAKGASDVREIVAGNQTSMARYPKILSLNAADALSAAHGALVDRYAALLDHRARTGRVRYGHGDLHLGNIALIEGRPTPFDCLEFNPALATIDVLYDLAFLLMDCWHRKLHNEANLLFNRYIDRSPEDELGIALLPLFLSVRATIRAHVLAAQSKRVGSDETLAALARSYLALAEDLLSERSTPLIAIGGLSGTGKSVLSRALAGSIGPPPGARILRSDVMRKRAAGVAPETRLTPESYSLSASAKVYAAIDEVAAAVLDQKSAVIADAVFAQRDERNAIEAIATRKGMPFSGIWLNVEAALRARRVTARKGDASDADAGVARAQLAIKIGDLGGWHTIEAGAALPAVVAAALTWLRRAQ